MPAYKNKTHKTYYFANRQKILEYAKMHRADKRAYDAKYSIDNKDKIREKGIKYRMTHEEQLRKRKSKYSKTARGKITKSKGNKKYLSRFPEKQVARRKLHKAIKLGKIERRPCEICKNIKSHGHHNDYSKPLSVIWLCHKHHMTLHKELKEINKSLKK